MALFTKNSKDTNVQTQKSTSGIERYSHFNDVSLSDQTLQSAQTEGEVLVKNGVSCSSVERSSTAISQEVSKDLNKNQTKGQEPSKDQFQRL